MLWHTIDFQRSYSETHPKFYNSPSHVKIDTEFLREFKILALDDQRDRFIGETGKLFTKRSKLRSIKIIGIDP